MNFHHVSVLLEECIENLNIKPDGIYVDGTMGGGGHPAAAGCTVEAPLTDVKSAVLHALRTQVADFEG